MQFKNTGIIDLSKLYSPFLRKYVRLSRLQELGTHAPKERLIRVSFGGIA